MSTDIDRVSSLNYITMQVNRHGAALMILFGTVGNLLNIRVLHEHTLGQNPFSIYLSWSSLSSTVFIWSGLLTRVLQGYNINWPNQNPPLCKIRLFILNTSWAMGTWCLVGASIDRFLCSSLSALYRQWSTKHIAKRYVIGVFIFFALLFIQVFYCFEASIPNVPVACYGRNLPCQIFNDWVSIAVDVVLPSIFLGIFGALTIRNARSRIVYPAVNVVNLNKNRLSIRRNERNLTRMLLIQVIIILLLDLPFGIYRSYASLTSNISKTAYRGAVENLTYSLIILLVYFTHSTSFYLYTLTGFIYREAVKRIARRCFRIQLRH